MLSKKVKLSLNYNQQLILETLSNEHRLLYNFLLEKVKDNIDFKQINENYKLFRQLNNLTINSKSAQNTSMPLTAAEHTPQLPLLKFLIVQASQFL